MEERLLDFARELERRDAGLATAIETVVGLESDTEAVGRQARELAERLGRLPGEQEAAASVAERAREELERRRERLERSEHELENARAGGDEREEAARRALERAREAAALAEERVGRADAEVARLHREFEETQAELPRLERRARLVAELVGAVPRLSKEGAGEPSPGLDGAEEWSSRARAALLLVRSGLETERERVVREANELGASALGEPLAATSVSGVRQRLEGRGAASPPGPRRH